MNVFLATRQLAFVSKLFSTAGLKLDEFIAGNDETALKAHLESIKSDGSAAHEAQANLLKSAGIALVANESFQNILKGALAAKDAQITAASTQVTVFSTGLTAARITLKASDEKKGLQATDVTKAIEDRAAIKAAEITASLGTTPVGHRAVADPAAAPKEAATEGLTGADKVAAGYRAKYGWN